ncbi:MAG TPA: phosphatase PAP2 family protein [Steroidobacteraceae bacterium]|nr:phosphatase PAP2 family protein [Steroidobacteraceae bacterium]
MNRAQILLQRFDLVEYRLCRSLNQAVASRALRRVFQVASRLGDGVIWYALVFILPLVFGLRALRPSLVMIATGVAGLLLYKALKHTLHRERPYIRHAGITLAMPPLDRYSFPSGHTLHAVSFTIQAVTLFPVLAWGLIPLAMLIAASRVVLGLHYPSDVLAGAGIGVALAEVGLAFN